MFAFPVTFWFAAASLIAGSVYAGAQLRTGVGIPMLTVLATVAFWYIGDAIYNDYAHNHVELFSEATLLAAWWQVGLFVVAFVSIAPALHSGWNYRHLSVGSHALRLYQVGVEQPAIQNQLKVLFKVILIVWLVLSAIAIFRLGALSLYYFAPYLAFPVNPWGRNRIGGEFDALYTVAFYLQMIIAALFGVIAALSTNFKVRLLAIALCLITWPFFIFDRTRNNILTVVVPASLSWGLLRVRGTVWKKLAVLGVCFGLIHVWFSFLIENRSERGIAAAVREGRFKMLRDKETRHLGLNMFEELCWINQLMREGNYHPNWGSRYFAELVNPIPRALWSGKPLIGIDYAIARGQEGGGDASAGVFATFSTGLIGQGVVNFGRFVGPIFAGFLMSIWAAILARFDLTANRVGRLPLFGLGLIVTFNLGRDITLITLYSFVFSWLLILVAQRLQKESHITPRKTTNCSALQFRPVQFGNFKNSTSLTMGDGLNHPGVINQNRPRSSKLPLRISRLKRVKNSGHECS